MAGTAPAAEEILDRAVTLEKEGWDYFVRASERTDNELAKRTFHSLASRHDRHADQIEEARRLVVARQTPRPRSVAPPRSMFEEIMRAIEQSAAPTAADIAELQAAIAYEAKVSDVYAHLARVSASDWEHSLYGLLHQEEQAMKLTLADTLDYLRSNFELSDLAKEQ